VYVQVNICERCPAKETCVNANNFHERPPMHIDDYHVKCKTGLYLNIWRDCLASAKSPKGWTEETNRKLRCGEKW